MPNGFGLVDEHQSKKGLTMPNTLFFVIAGSATLNVRETPSLSGKIVAQLFSGDQIDIDLSNPMNTVEADGWVWRHYQDNWVAECKIDNSLINLLTVPRIHSLFEVLPVDITQMSHFYYYGNTLFAYCCGREHNYDGYSQGLHGGLDFGHNGGLEIRAGVTGTFRSITQQFFPPNCIRVETQDGYTVLYGHVAKPLTQLANGDSVTPDTVLGHIDVNRQHLHLEVRYQREKYIVNPLLLMPESLSQALINAFPANGRFRFFQNANWIRWQTPVDQPIIRRGSARLLGPTVGKAEDELANNPACQATNC
jgi:hypothetical protein